MSLLDKFRLKWKNPDPEIRAEGVRELTDQALLETIAASDPSEVVRLAAMQTLTDQDKLASLALGKAAHAEHAARRLTDPGLIAKVALGADSRAVREIAAARVNDGAILHRISTSDPDEWVRLTAQSKSTETNLKRTVIQSALSGLPITAQPAGTKTSFSGTLGEVCDTLLLDRRFRISGGFDAAEPAEPTSKPGDPAAPGNESGAKFLAFKRGETGAPFEVAKSSCYFQIRIWRIAQDKFEGVVEEMRLELATNTVVWSRASGGVPEMEPLAGSETGEKPPTGDGVAESTGPT